MNTLVLLDLEQTIIPSWEDMWLDLSATAKIKEFLKNQGVTSISLGLMSWAVWHEEDKVKFRNELLPEIEKEFDAHFELVWSMQDWANEVFMTTKRKVSIHDLFDMMGKHEVLMACRSSPSLVRQVFFFDDTAHHGLRLTSAQGLDLNFINIDWI